jgi:hypothetical protein
MPTRNGKRPIIREGEPSQKTEKGLEIPIPTAAQFEDALKRVSRKGRGKREKPSKSGSGKRRTSR